MDTVGSIPHYLIQDYQRVIETSSNNNNNKQLLYLLLVARGVPTGPPAWRSSRHSLATSNKYNSCL